MAIPHPAWLRTLILLLLLTHLTSSGTALPEHSKHTRTHPIHSRGYQHLTHLTSSGTALMLVKPFLNTTNTLLAPQRSADVQQSNAVSPAPSTITTPFSSGNLDLHAHIPKKENKLEQCVCSTELETWPPQRVAGNVTVLHHEHRRRNAGRDSFVSKLYNITMEYFIKCFS